MLRFAFHTMWIAFVIFLLATLGILGPTAKLYLQSGEPGNTIEQVVHHLTPTGDARPYTGAK